MIESKVSIGLGASPKRKKKSMSVSPYFCFSHLHFIVMALWTAKVILNNSLFSTEFESISPFGSDAKTEAMGRFGTDNVQLFPKSNALRGRV